MYRRPGRGRVLLLACLALSIFLITLDFRQNPGGPIKRAKELATSIVSPIQRGFAAVTQPVGDLLASLGDLANIRSRNRVLESRLVPRGRPVVAGETPARSRTKTLASGRSSISASRGSQWTRSPRRCSPRHLRTTSGP